MRPSPARLSLFALALALGSAAPSLAQETVKKRAETTTTTKKAEPIAKRAAVKLDLNSATAAELEAGVPGMTATLTREVVRARPYKTLDDFKKVRGITPALFDSMSPHLRVAPVAMAREATKDDTRTRTEATKKEITITKKAPLPPGKKININTATAEELELLPGIGPVRSAAIIKARPFATIEDIMKVEGIKEGIFGPIKEHLSVK